jgi:hypothetical protein
MSAAGGLAIAIITGALLGTARLTAPAQPAPFPDVLPWHWAYQAATRDAQAGLVVGYPTAPAELIANSIQQIYDGFVHAQSPSAQTWVERFTYDRPAAWPAPLERSRLAGFSVRDLRTTVSGDRATATFTVQHMGAAAAANPVHVDLRWLGGDWKIDYATLASGDPLFR